jgi:thermitase
MKSLIITVLCLLSFGLYSQEYMKDRIIAKLKNTDREIESLKDISSLNSFFEENTISEIKPLDFSSSKNLNGRPLIFIFSSEVDIQKVITHLKNTNLFEYVEPDFIVKTGGVKISNENISQTSLAPLAVTPNDPYFFRQWGLFNNGTFNLNPSIPAADVKMREAWEITTGSPTISIAIIDTGIRMEHPEFTGRILLNQNDVINGIDDDGNGLIDDFYGWDFTNNDNNPSDDNGHGTNVTGITVANSNNGIGYAGVDWNCKLLPLKVLDSEGSGSYSNMISSVYYSISRSVDVISMSIGGSGYSAAFHEAAIAAYNANIPFLACMMNFNSNVPYYPAAFPQVIAVGSTDPDDKRSSPFFWDPSSGSNYGNHIDVVAPGNFIYGLSHWSNTDYDGYWGGTSQATPLVAGIVTLMLSIEPNLTVEEIRTILRTTAQDQVGRSWEDTPGFDPYHGAGRVNAYQALLDVQHFSTPNIDSSTISIYPNPTKDRLYIQSDYGVNDIKIYDITGRFIKKHEHTSEVDMTTLNKGIYLLKISTDQKTFETKVIKQ